MKVEVVGKNGFQPSDENREFIESKLQKVENYFSEQKELRARVVAKVYPTYQKVEVTIPTKNVTLRAESKGQDLYCYGEILNRQGIGRKLSWYTSCGVNITDSGIIEESLNITLIGN